MTATLDPTIPSRYFLISGGTTVLEAQDGKWIRWDRWDGPVETSIGWTAETPTLKEITREEALALRA